MLTSDFHMNIYAHMDIHTNTMHLYHTRPEKVCSSKQKMTQEGVGYGAIRASGNGLKNTRRKS